MLELHLKNVLLLKKSLETIGLNQGSKSGCSTELLKSFQIEKP
jgi:hypothetical protein